STVAAWLTATAKLQKAIKANIVKFRRGTKQRVSANIALPPRGGICGVSQPWIIEMLTNAGNPATLIFHPFLSE
ncbi:MAG: hypothetical protein WCD01_03205, partial [Candidatus Sulfotelmatobacter sp.]